MSGHPFETTMDENRERRYRQMVANIINNSVPQSSIESVHESRMEHSMVNNTHHHSTLPTRQFYTNNPIATSSLCNTISHVPTQTASTYAPSDASVFKLPQTTRQFKMSSLKFDKLDNELSLINTGLRSLEDKKVVKLLLRQIKTGIFLASAQRNVSNSTIPELLEGISNTVLELYYTGNVPRSDMSLQSRMSDRPMLNAEQYGSSQMSCVPMDRIFPSSQTFNPGNVARSDMSLQSRMSDRPMPNSEQYGSNQMSSVPMDRFYPSSQTFNQSTVNLHRFDTTSAQTVPVPVSSRSVSQLSETSVAQRRGRPPNKPKPSTVPEESDDGDCLFNESMFAQRRDEIASKQATFSDTSFALPQPPRLARTKPTSRRGVNGSGVIKAKVETAVSENSPALALSNNNSTMTLPEGTRGVTRAGRQIKTPALYWKGFESMRDDTSMCANKTTGQGNKDTFNDSMILRSSTVKKTPPLKNVKNSNKNTPLNTIIEDRNVPKAVKVKKSSAKKDSGKENDELPKKKAAPKKKSAPKKKNDVINEDKATSSKQAAAAKVPKAKKQDSATQEKQTMASKKRKSLETDNTAAKKKKVEEELLESSDIDSDDDELFGAFTYKKPTQTALQALSPNTGMISAKKAAGPLGKETPPCKALGMMINMSGHSAASSVTMEAPLAKGAQVVKRVTKNLEKDQKKATKKVPNKKSKKEDAETKNALEEAVKYTYTSRTPQSTVVYSMFRGNAPETDDSDDYDDDDDDDADLL